MKLRTFVLAAALTAALAAPAWALTPDEVAVVVNGLSPNSRAIAAHYLAARDIPRDNVLVITVQPGETISEADYEARIKVPIRRQLEARKLKDKIKCLVTTYDVPLKISEQKPNAEEATEITGIQGTLKEATAALRKAHEQYEAVAAAGEQQAAPAATLPEGKEASDLRKIAQALDKSARAAMQRVSKLPVGDERNEAMRAMLVLHEQVLGLAGVVSMFAPAGNTPEADAAAAQFAAMRKQVETLQEQFRQASQQPDGPKRRSELLALQRKIRGNLGVALQSEAFLNELKRDQSDAALDNELMLLWEDNYRKTQWLWHERTVERWGRLNPQQREAALKTIMVARLDGPTVEKTREMINATIKAEEKGLEGTAYFDARGLRGGDAYGAFDADIRKAAKYLRDNTDMKVVLDDQNPLLVARDCPNAALYCGWYSVGNYKDSCQWLPGSVAYHVASWEMPTLRNPKSGSWVPNLLARGVAGTMGSVSEPYLFAFSKPSQFFPLLVSGLYTQGEVYYLTTPNISWRLGFVGDPLYNPYKRAPKLTRDQIAADPILKNALDILPREAPATAPATAPARR